jgi:hypothetical protein
VRRGKRWGVVGGEGEGLSECGGVGVGAVVRVQLVMLDGDGFRV